MRLVHINTDLRFFAASYSLFPYSNAVCVRRDYYKRTANDCGDDNTYGFALELDAVTDWNREWFKARTASGLRL
jgi:hypothetical protein